MKRTTINVLLILAVLVLCGVLLHSHLSSAPAPAEKMASPAPTPVTVVEVQQKPIFDRIEALGTTSANEAAAISAAITEKVVSIHFEDGQLVEAGDLLVTLKQDEERAQHAAALEQLAEHKRELKRRQTLLQENVIPNAIMTSG
jgi:membrane fusion protein (multidrug efflux system)